MYRIIFLAMNGVLLYGLFIEGFYALFSVTLLISLTGWISSFIINYRRAVNFKRNNRQRPAVNYYYLTPGC